MPITRLLGAVFLAIGVMLLWFAYHASRAPVERLSNTLTGHFSDQTMLYLILGAVGVVGGGLLFAFGARK
jgi:uncharacterized membrane protein